MEDALRRFLSEVDLAPFAALLEEQNVTTMEVFAALTPSLLNALKVGDVVLVLASSMC
jgi:hypothetical protein